MFLEKITEAEICGMPGNKSSFLWARCWKISVSFVLIDFKIDQSEPFTLV